MGRRLASSGQAKASPSQSSPSSNASGIVGHSTRRIVPRPRWRVAACAALCMGFFYIERKNVFVASLPFSKSDLPFYFKINNFKKLA
jgi:hypothetical protein